MKCFYFILLYIVIANFSLGQEVANFTRKNSIVSPEITDSSVIYRLRAPEANNVVLYAAYLKENIKMTKNNEGVWECSTSLPACELYLYKFIVDGIEICDPNNVLQQRDGVNYYSMVIIPGERTSNYVESAKEHGSIHQVWYESPTLGMTRRLYVYTPYGYEDSDKSYPVLYLFHGAGGDEDAWTNMGRARQILDNLIEKGEAVPMIVVMPNGNANQVAAAPLNIPGLKFDRRDPKFFNAYPHSVAKDIVPYVESHFRCKIGKENRAVAGLSMGAGHTITVSTLYPDMFDYICPLSNGIAQNNQKTIEGLQALKQSGYKLYWIGCGEDDFLIQRADALDSTLTALNMPHTYVRNDGGHTWNNWRYYLNNFAKLLFK